MAAFDKIAGDFFVPTRDAVVRDWKRDYKLRAGFAVVDNSPQDADANVMSDTLMPLYADAKAVGNNVALDDKNSAGLEAEAARIGIPPRLAAAGGTGFVQITASVGGGPVVSGDEIKDISSGFRYQALVTGTFADGSAIAITGIDTGPSTNLPAETVLQWTTPRPGMGATAIVIEQSDGSGLSGGRTVEDDGALKERVRDAKANPPAAGNDAELQLAVTKTPGVAVEQPFTWACMSGPGTTNVAFTQRPSSPGRGRAPNSAAIALARAYVVNQFPKDDGLIFCTIIEVAQDLTLQLDWAPGAPGWIDASVYPKFADAAHVIAVTSATAFQLAGGTPVPGQTVAFFNNATGAFVRKRLLTVDGSLNVTVDTSNGVSDSQYVPAVSETFCPWSDSLPVLVPPVLTYFGTLGPGSMVATPFDEGARQQCNPVDPYQWPSKISHRVLSGLYSLTSVDDVEVATPSLPLDVAVGTPNVSANMFVLGKLLAFPLS